MKKRIFTLFICVAILISAVPCAIAEDGYSELTIDESAPLAENGDGYAVNIADGTTVAELIANFKDKNRVTVTDKSGNTLELLDEVGSDSVVSYVNGDKTLKTAVMGDVNSDAKFSAKDVSAAVKKLAGYDNGACVPAINVNGDSNSNGKDVSTMLRKLAGGEVSFVSPMLKDTKASADNSGINFWFTDIMDRIGRSVTTTSNGSKDRVYRMAKTEIETAQLMLTSDADYKDMTFELSDLVNENGAKLDCGIYMGFYYNLSIMDQLWGADWTKTTSDYFVDPILEYHGDKFDLSANQSKLVYFRVHTWADTEAGFYKATFNLKDSAGNVVKTGTFRVYVWDFVLSEETASASAFHFDSGSAVTDAASSKLISKISQVTQDEVDYVKELWYEFLLDNRLTAYHLPYDVDDERNEKYINNPRVTSFVATGGSVSTDLTYEGMAEMYRRHADDENWIKKAYIYTVDEPCTWEQFDKMDEQWNALCELLPDIDFRVVTPLASNYYNSTAPEGLDWVARTFRSTNILCPQTYAFTPYSDGAMRREHPELYPTYSKDFSGGTFGYRKNGDFKDRYEEARATGDYDMWWYVCVSPGYPYANFFNSYQGVDCRVLLWQQYMNDIDGLLYWHVNYWMTKEKGGTVINKKYTGTGDGLLIYPPSLFGLQQPVPSVRLEYVRDGFEDFQYMTQLEEIVGRDAVMEYVNNVTTGMLLFTEDCNVLQGERDNIGFMLESVSK